MTITDLLGFNASDIMPRPPDEGKDDQETIKNLVSYCRQMNTAFIEFVAKLQNNGAVNAFSSWTDGVTTVNATDTDEIDLSGLDAGELDTNVPLIRDITFSLSGTTPQWTAGYLRYGGTEYSVNSGSGDAGDKGVYVDVTSLLDPITLEHSATITAAAGKWYLAIVDGGVIYETLQAPLISGGLIQANSITADRVVLTGGDTFDTSDLNNDEGWTQGADWASDLDNIPTRFANSPSTSGLYLTASYLGFYDATVGVADWTVFIKNNGDFYFGGDGDNYIEWDGTAGTLNVSAQGGKIGSTDNFFDITNGQLQTRESGVNMYTVIKNGGILCGAGAGVTTTYASLSSYGLEVNSNAGEGISVINLNSGGTYTTWMDVSANANAQTGIFKVGESNHRIDIISGTSTYTIKGMSLENCDTAKFAHKYYEGDGTSHAGSWHTILTFDFAPSYVTLIPMLITPVPVNIVAASGSRDAGAFKIDGSVTANMSSYMRLDGTKLEFTGNLGSTYYIDDAQYNVLAFKED